jgi:hypothetical protein
MRFFVLTLVLVQAKAKFTGQIVDSVLLCFQQHNVKVMMADIRAAHANAHLGGVLDLTRVNENEEGIEAAQKIIRDIRKRLADHSVPALACGSATVRNLDRCVSVRREQLDDPDDRCGGGVQALVDSVIEQESGWVWLTDD